MLSFEKRFLTLPLELAEHCDLRFQTFRLAAQVEPPVYSLPNQRSYGCLVSRRRCACRLAELGSCLLARLPGYSTRTFRVGTFCRPGTDAMVRLVDRNAFICMPINY